MEDEAALTAENEYPDISTILRERLVESLLAEGILAGDAEVVADDVIAFARERGAELRARRMRKSPVKGGER